MLTDIFLKVFASGMRENKTWRENNNANKQDAVVVVAGRNIGVEIISCKSESTAGGAHKSKKSE